MSRKQKLRENEDDVRAEKEVGEGDELPDRAIRAENSSHIVTVFSPPFNCYSNGFQTIYVFLNVR